VPNKGFHKSIHFIGVPCYKKYKHIATKVNLKKRWFKTIARNPVQEVLGPEIWNRGNNQALKKSPNLHDFYRRFQSKITIPCCNPIKT